MPERNKATKKKMGTVRKMPAPQPPANDGNMPEQMQVTTNMGVPIAPDQLFEVNKGLFASLQEIVKQMGLLQQEINSKANAAALALGAEPGAHIILSQDMKYIAVYNQDSIDRANKEAFEKAKADLPVVEEEQPEEAPAE